MSQYFKYYPPFKIHSSRPISADKALEFISTYLADAETDDGLNSNTVLSGAGPVMSTPGIGDGRSSLTTHNLRRIQAALKGEYLAPSPNPGGEDALDGSDGVVPETPVKNGTGEKRKRAATVAGNGTAEADSSDWQEREEYEQQQEQIDGEVGDRMPHVVQGAQAVVNLKSTEKSIDKEARKKAKKERKNKDKKDREKKRKRNTEEN